MLKKRFALGLAVLVLAACDAANTSSPLATAAAASGSASSRSVASQAASASKVAPEKVSVDTPRTTAGGATFKVPAGFTVAADGARTIVTGPEPDLRLAIVETDAKSADEAVAAAWPALRPDFKRTLRLSQPQPARDGWEEIRSYDYETSPNEKLWVAASARRSGATWVVTLLETGTASGQKRSAAVGLFVKSLRPKGYAKESFAGKTPHELDAGRVKQILESVDEGRNLFAIPGVAVSLVQGGKVVYEGGLGVRELGKPDPVDEDSLFIIASNTKALSTLLLAKEIDDGKFTWETPVTQVYPDFKLGNADTTSKVRMKHLVCACTGMPRQDYEWLFEFKDATAKATLALLGSFQPTTKFGEAFQYSNLMAAAAGYIGGHVAFPQKELGAAYDQAMQEKLFDPMGMTPHDLRLRQGDGDRPRLAAQVRRRRQDEARAHGHEPLGGADPPGGRRMVEREGPHPVRADGARQGQVAER